MFFVKFIEKFITRLMRLIAALTEWSTGDEWLQAGKYVVTLSLKLISIIDGRNEGNYLSDKGWPCIALLINSTG